MDFIEQLREQAPAAFPGKDIKTYLPAAPQWSTIQNKRSRREIPDECFVRSGLHVLIKRDAFLDWWKTTLTDVRTPIDNPPPRSRRATATA